MLLTLAGEQAPAEQQSGAYEPAALSRTPGVRGQELPDLGGVVDKVLSFVIDLFLTIPFLLAALTLAPILNERFNTYDAYPTIQKFSLIGVLAFFG